MGKKTKYMGVTATQELINLLKADFAKKQDIIQFVEMPSPVTYVGRTIEYVGETNAQFTNGHFYHSDGFNWIATYESLENKTWALVDSLPAYSDADFNTIYFVKQGDMITGWIKGETQMEPITSTSSWQLVTALPPWSTAKNDVLYLVLNGSTLTGCVKNPDVTDEWYQMGGGRSNFNELDNIPSINGISLQNTVDPAQPKEVSLDAKVQKYPDSAHWDEHAVYPPTPTDVPVNELELKAFTDEEIQQVYDDVTGA